MQKAGNLSSQCDCLQHVTERARRIEKLALELCRDCVPLHDNGRPEAAKNMLLDLCDSSAIATLTSVFDLRMDVARTDHFIEIVRQPVLVLRQITETLLRTLKFANFAGDVRRFC